MDQNTVQPNLMLGSSAIHAVQNALIKALKRYGSLGYSHDMDWTAVDVYFIAGLFNSDRKKHSKYPSTTMGYDARIKDFNPVLVARWKQQTPQEKSVLGQRVTRESTYHLFYLNGGLIKKLTGKNTLTLVK